MGNPSTPLSLKRVGDHFAAPNAPLGYWGEIPEVEFDALLDHLARSDNFDRTILDFFSHHRRQDLYPYITDVHGRSAWLELIDQTHGDLAVDLGAGMGAIAESLLTRFSRVWAVEGCKKRCAFLTHRKRLKHLPRLEIVHGDLLQLPFESASVDLAVCNGGLEWVAVGKPGPVRPIQMAFLCEVARILKPGGTLYIGIENRLARQYLRGVPDHPGTKYTSLLPRWLATALVRRQRATPGFSVPDLSSEYRNYTYTAPTLRHLLRMSGLPFVSLVCVEPSYDVPRYAFSLGQHSEDLQQFFTTFLKRRFHPFLDKILSNNYWVFASKRRMSPGPEGRPLFFGYFDTLSIEGRFVHRKPVQGPAWREPIVRGTPLLQRRQPPQVEEVASAFRAFLARQDTPHAAADLCAVRSEFETYLGGRLSDEMIANLIRLVATQHAGGCYHGDFWLGNVVFDETRGECVLIDPEPQLFGSAELDVADFAIDFYLNQRARPGDEDFPQRLASILETKIRSQDLLVVALARQVVRYTPAHRSHSLVYTYISLLQQCIDGSPPSALACLASDRG